MCCLIRSNLTWKSCVRSYSFAAKCGLPVGGQAWAILQSPSISSSILTSKYWIFQFQNHPEIQDGSDRETNL